jgi:hypothetical protein
LFGSRLLLALTVCLVLGRPAAAKNEIKFLKVAELPSLNLILKVMADAKEAPLPPPTVHTYRISSGGVESVREMFLPADLWRQGQVAGRWSDSNGNTLAVAVLACPLVKKEGSPPHVTREQYAQLLARSGESGPWDEPAIRRWLADFLGATEVAANPAAKVPPRLAGLIEYAGQNQAGINVGYVFRLNPNQPGQFGAPTSWFCVNLQLAPGLPPEPARAALLNGFLPSLLVSRTARPILPTPPPPPPRPGGTNRPAARSPEFLASRQQVADSIRNMKDWWLVETENYIILSNLKSRNLPLVKHLKENVELLRSAFEQFIPAQAEISAVSVIRIFATPQEYLQYVGPDYAWSSGIWMPDRKELVIRPVDLSSAAAEDARVLSVVYHEMFHQYIFYALGRLETAPWFNEGQACFFENSVMDARHFDVNENEAKARIVTDLLKAGPVDLSGLLRMSQKDFYAGGEEARRRNYATAWALIYYLRKANQAGKPFPYAGLSDAYCAALVQLRNPDQATAQAFAKIDQAQLQADFAAFWKSSQKRDQARRNRIFKSFSGD